MNILRQTPIAAPPDYPRFCRRCGSALVPECQPAGYNDRTGAPQYVRWLRCPKYEGGQTRVVSYAPFYHQTAMTLDETYTRPQYEHYGAFGYESYFDCSPLPAKPVTRDEIEAIRCHHAGPDHPAQPCYVVHEDGSRSTCDVQTLLAR